MRGKFDTPFLVSFVMLAVIAAGGWAVGMLSFHNHRNSAVEHIDAVYVMPDDVRVECDGSTAVYLRDHTDVLSGETTELVLAAAGNDERCER